jgi:Mrp family chromosome partitioning ATPase
VAVLPSGPLPPNPSELVGSPKMQQVMSELSEAFEHVIVDSPPMLVVADSLELAKHVDGVIVVIRLKQATSDDVKELRLLAGRLGIHLVGVVVTDVPVRSEHGYGSYTAAADGERVGHAAPVPLPSDRAPVPAPHPSRASAQEH